MSDDFSELTGNKKPILPSQNATTGLQQVNSTNSTAEKVDPELARLEKLHQEIERKNDEDSAKGLTVQIDPMKNQTFLAMVKTITSKEKETFKAKMPLVE